MSVPVTLPTVVPTPVSTPVPVLPTAEPDLAALRLPAALALSAAGGAPPTPPTLAMVAEEAGVSAATASRVLNGSPRVRPATRRLVKDAMERLGYVRNRAARSNQTTGRTGFIALVVCEEGLRMFSDPFFPRALRGVTKALAPNRVHLVLITVHSARDHAAATQFVRAGHVDGAIYVSMHGRLFVEPEHLGVPVVLFGRPATTPGMQRLPCVDVDNRDGAEKAVRHLVNSGRTAIATIAGPPDMKPGIDRLAGYRAVMAAAGRNDMGLIGYGDFGQMSGEHATYRLLDRKPPIDAVFAASDLMAAGALRALRRAGRRVPDDVAVVGFDDSPLAQHTVPTLTTVRQPVEEMGARVVSELLSLCDQQVSGRQPPEPRCVIMDTELIIRESG